MAMLSHSLRLVNKMKDRLLFQWDSIQNLTEEGASLSLGWFEFYHNGLSISFFKERKCMLFLTLTNLIDFLSSENVNNSFKWVCEDDGSVYVLKRKDKYLQIENRSVLIKINYDLFKSVVFDASLNMKNNILSKNPHIREEGAFIDFENSVKKIAENSV